MRKEIRPIVSEDLRRTPAVPPVRHAVPSSDTIDLGRMVDAARRHWRRIGIGVVTGLVLAFAYVRIAVPRYQATATVRIDPRQSTLPTIYTERSNHCLLYTSPSPRDRTRSRMPSSA